MNTNQLKDIAVSYALANGLLHGEIIEGKQYYTHMPISLFPFVIPKKTFANGEELNKLFDELVMHIVSNPEWLFKQLKDVTDDFTMHLVDIAKKALQSPYYQPLCLGILRSDYMIDQSDPYRLLQIELNTISCSFVGVEEKLSQLHQFLLSSNSNQFQSIAKFMNISTDDLNSFIEQSSYNQTCVNTCNSLANAVNYYNSQYSNKQNTSILIVNQENENNNVDQFLLSTRLSQVHHIHCIYQTHTELATSMSIHDGILNVNGNEIAVVYYRSAYTPSDYPSSLQWEVRQQLECSLAIKCPNVLLHLAGCKKVQQQLCLPGILEEVISDKSKVELLRSCFTDLYPAVDVIKNQELYQVVCEHPELFVLKPQREGGGYNIWNEEIVRVLQRQDQNELASLILMKRIFPQPTSAYHIKDRQMECYDSLSEIGFYSGVLFDSKKKEIIQATNIGVLVRTKLANSNEGGVSAGFAVMNSPIISS